MLTIGYCMLLNSRLKRLKADESSLKATIGELITATEIAERAIGGLKLTVRDVNENLNAQLTAAGAISIQLKKQLAEGDNVVRRISKIASAARAPSDIAVETPASAAVSGANLTSTNLTSAKAIAQAAQAFSERRRSNGLAA
jgi:chromosome segregation ATPase